MPCIFSIVRHGQTIANIGGVIQSRTGGELTAKGMEMATSLGKLLAEKNETFTRIYSSDLNRCKQTTAHIVEQLKPPVPDVVYTPLLRERDYGAWELHPANIKEYQDAIAKGNLTLCNLHKVEIPTGESYEATRERAAKFFEEILQIADQTGDNQTENIMAVSHGNLIHCFIDNLVQDTSKYKAVNFTEEMLQTNCLNTCRTQISIGKADATGVRTIEFTLYLDTEHYKFLCN